MKYFSCLFLIVFFSSMSLFSQEKLRQHTVAKGETISEIAKKYQVEQSAIYELNPDAVNGIKLKSVLLIPTKAKKSNSISVRDSARDSSEKTHEVLPKETLYGITKQYKVSLEDLYKSNPNLEKEGLKTGQVLKLPQTALVDFPENKIAEKTIEVPKTNLSQKKNLKEEPAVVEIKNNNKIELPTNTIQHEVLPKESLYSIAKLYKITLSDLQKANSELGGKSLKVGQKINVPGQAEADSNLVADKKELKPEKENLVSTPAVVEKKNQKMENAVPVVVPAKVETTNESQAVVHEVLPKESLYSIAKLYKITLSDLQKANPELAGKSLKVGQKISVPGQAEAESTLVADTKEAKENLVLTPAVVEKKNQKMENAVPVVVPAKVETTKESQGVVHEVLPKESLYSIAKLYKITLSDLQKANPDLGKKSLKVGQKISIPGDIETNLIAASDTKEAKTQTESSVLTPAVVEKKGQDANPTNPAAIPSTVENLKEVVAYTHEVLPKETKYGIAKQYGLSVVELEKQNPAIAKNLLVGSKLKILSSKSIEKTASMQTAIAIETEYVKEKFEKTNTNITHDEAFVDQLISRASENIGTRYRSGGTTKEGFDCSGLMCYTFSESDIKLPRSSIEMASYGSKIDTQDAQKGDLIFFKTSGRGRITHVGMVVEVLDGEIKFIHSSNHGGVIISSTKESYYERSLVQINRVL